MFSKKFIYIAGFITLFGLGGLGVALMYFFHDLTLYDIFLNGRHSILLQLILGSAYALLSMIILLSLLKRKLLDSTRYFFSDLLKKFRLNYAEIIFLSFCAGVGEELLFRGAIQPWLGIWLTAFIFILLHGYLNPRDKPLFIYGMVLFIISAGFGYLMNYSGLFAAAIAHFWIDVGLMVYLKKEEK